MTALAGLADAFAEPRCTDCSGVKVSVTAWLEMSAADVARWVQRYEAELARARSLSPGKAIPSPLLCTCGGDPLGAAIARLRGRELESPPVRLAIESGGSS